MSGIYLDHQASTPMSSHARDMMFRSFSETYANPHSADHSEGWRASAAVEKARGQVANAIGADVDEVVFTSGATEANNIALLGVAAATGSPGRVVVTAIEHKSVLAPVRALADRGWDVVVMPVGRDGIVDVSAIETALKDRTTIVSVGVANNEIGTVQPIADIAAACRRAGTMVHVDAAQALSWRGLDLAMIDVDFASFSAHKAGGPKGIGAIYVRRTARDRIAAVQFGGGQEDGLRPGTLPTQLCVGFGAACEALPDEAAIARWREVTAHLLNGLRAAVPGVIVNGPTRSRHPGNLSLTFPGVEVGALVARLQPGVALSRGSACTSGIAEPSHVLTAIGLNSIDAEATVRLSTGPNTTMAEVHEATDLIGEAVRFI